MNKSYWNGKRVFVSGGAGVIGRELTERLVAAGCDVFVGDLEPRPSVFGSAVRYRQGDLNHAGSDLFLCFKPEVFFHLAATFERTTESLDFWDENYRHNIQLSHHLMSLARECLDLQRVVFASSYLVYDPALYLFEEEPAETIPLKEDTLVRPRNMIGMAKYSHEMELSFLSQYYSKQFTSTAVRIFRGYGKGSRDIISRWVRNLLCGEEIAVYRPEGRFDYIYDADNAEGLIRVAEQEGFQGVVNLGTGQARSVAEVLSVLAVHFPQMKVRNESSDIAIECSAADISRLEELTAWKPEYTIEKGIAEIVAHERAAGTKKSCAVVDERSAGNVFISSLGREFALVREIRRALASLDMQGEVIGADMDPACRVRPFVDQFWQMPSLDEIDSSQLLRELQRLEVGYIVPTRDGELLFWNSLEPQLDKLGMKLLLSGRQALEICLDKLRFSSWCREHGFPAIETAERIEDLSAEALVVKERSGSGTRSTALDLTPAEAVKFGEQLVKPVYMPLIHGREYSADAYVNSTGKCVGVICREREVVEHGESQVTTAAEDRRMEQMIAQLVEQIGIRGAAVVQYIVDPAGEPHLIECNARFGGASSLAVACGLDIFRWLFIERTGGAVSETDFRRAALPLTQIRYPSDMYVRQ